MHTAQLGNWREKSMVEEEEEEVEEGGEGEGMRAGIQNGGEILKFCNFKKCEFGTVANSFQVLRGNILVESKSQVEKNIQIFDVGIQLDCKGGDLKKV